MSEVTNNEGITNITNNGITRRSRAALRAGAVAAGASRAAGYQGQVILGRIALMLQPNVLSELARDREVMLVSGTNGKTTTTAMLAAAMSTRGPVASNSSGANMLDGLATAMAEQDARTVVGEIDEMYLPAAVQQTNPVAVVLLGFSRDQLDRAGEVRKVATHLRALAQDYPDLMVVGNCDDPYVVYIANQFRRAVWVSAGSSWQGDAGNCPNCGNRLDLGDDAQSHWECGRCGLQRPTPQWRLSGEKLLTPDGRTLPLTLRLPGAFNFINASMAVAASSSLGIPAETAVHGVAELSSVAGRYKVVRVGQHELQLLLAKNPAGWAASLDLLCSTQDPVIIAINALEADGRDTSWLYDVEFERLAGRQVIAAGDRAYDIGVRLTYAGVTHITSPDPLAALGQLAPGQVLAVGDYTSFFRLRNRLGAQA